MRNDEIWDVSWSGYDFVFAGDNTWGENCWKTQRLLFADMNVLTSSRHVTILSSACMHVFNLSNFCVSHRLFFTVA